LARHRLEVAGRSPPRRSFVTGAMPFRSTRRRMEPATNQETPMLAWIGVVLGTMGAAPAAPQSIWLEAESLGPLRGSNFSYMKPEQQARGSCALAGPDVAAAWTQGGESEFMSVAARADEAPGVTIGRDVEIPVAGLFRLWVRYADYRGREEAFGVRVRQG